MPYQALVSSSSSSPVQRRPRRKSKQQHCTLVWTMFSIALVGGLVLQVWTALFSLSISSSASLERTTTTVPETTQRKQHVVSSVVPETAESLFRFQHQQQSGEFPRVVFMEIQESSLSVHITTTITSTNTTTTTNRWVQPLGGPCPYCQIERPSDPYPPECQQPMASWQTTFYPTCNTLHEIALGEPATFLQYNNSSSSTMKYSNDTNHQKGEVPDDNIDTDENDETLELLSLAGSWRSVWKYKRRQRASSSLHNSTHNIDNDDETVVLKLLHLRRNFTHDALEYHRVDAVAMERLTASQGIVSAFGFCGHSVLTELSSGSARLFVKDKQWKSHQRLALGRDLAQALADVHSIDGTDHPPSLTHNDFNMANAVVVQGRVKLNDFNIGNLLRRNTTSTTATSSTNTTSTATTCQTPVRFAAPFWKSPEENHQTMVDGPPTDVYGLGNLLFQVLTRRQPWTHLEPGGKLTIPEIVQRKDDGIGPFVPEKIVQSKKISEQALYHAVQACFRKEPSERPTALQLAKGMGTALEWTQQKRKKVSRHEMERLFSTK